LSDVSDLFSGYGGETHSTLWNILTTTISPTTDNRRLKSKKSPYTLITKVGKLWLGCLLGALAVGVAVYGWRFGPHPPPPIVRPSPPAPREPAERARRDLQRAYEEIKLAGVFFNGESKVGEDWRLGELLKQSRDLYNRARGEYDAGSYARAGAEARAGVSAANALRHLHEALAVASDRRPSPSRPAELTPPPEEEGHDRRAFDRLAEAHRLLQTFDSYTPLVVDPEEQRLVALAQEIATRAYHQSTDELSAGRFNRSEKLAQAVRELSEIAEHLGNASDGPPKPPPPRGGSPGASP
jgi:hypothetical protein